MKAHRIANSLAQKFPRVSTLCLWLTLPFLCLDVGMSAEADGYNEFVLPILKSHCVKCHGTDEDTVEADVNLATLQRRSLSANVETLETLIDVLELRQMPPEDELPLDSTARGQMVKVLRGILKESLAQQTAFAHTPIRRLNRLQYNNAVVDLLELKIDLFALPERMMRDHSNYFDPASRKMPETVKVGSRPLGKSQLVQNRLAGVGPYPQDLRAEHGFDNRGDHLSLSPLLMESFLKLSRSIVESRDFGQKTCGAWGRLFLPPAEDVSDRVEVQRRLRQLLTRAFRRTVTDEVLKPYTNYVMARIAAGDSFTEGMKLAVSAVLASPRFLYLYERGGQKGAESLDDFELASRLSFFLWGSLPDEELLNLAAEQRLSEPEVLGEQITRLLNDRKLKRFCDSFPAQWLQLEQIISAQPDPDKFAKFYRGQYRASIHMMAEPLLLFETVLIEDRSVLELIDPPFSYRSNLLKTWLRKGEAGNFLPTVQVFDRVDNTDRREGGVITNPAVMTMTASPERSKPITRGAWIAGVIFNSPPKPPPADVPPLPEGEDAETEKLTLREQLDLHRERADCRGCHEQIDPLGFAMENYGPTGMWRDKYENGRPVDSTGILFGRHQFSNPIEFKDAVLAEKERFTRAFARHILSYALGRETEATDSAAIDEIATRTMEDGYKIRTLIRQVALSAPFLSKHNPQNPQMTAE